MYVTDENGTPLNSLYAIDGLFCVFIIYQQRQLCKWSVERATGKNGTNERSNVTLILRKCFFSFTDNSTYLTARASANGNYVQKWNGRETNDSNAWWRRTLIESIKLWLHRTAKWHVRPSQWLNIIEIKLSFYVLFSPSTCRRNRSATKEPCENIFLVVTNSGEISAYLECSP